VRVGPHAQATLPEWRAKPHPTTCAPAEAERLAARPACSPALPPAEPTPRAAGSEDGLTAAVRPSGRPGSAVGAASAWPSDNKAANRCQAAGRAPTENGYAWWCAAAAGPGRDAARRRELLSDALAQMDREIGAELVQVRGDDQAGHC
jgi:hypothetical protein